MKNARRRGMTLIEIVVVIAITTMLMSAVGLYAIGQWRESQVNVAKTELKTLEAGLDTYLALTGHYPDPAAGLRGAPRATRDQGAPGRPVGQRVHLDARRGSTGDHLLRRRWATRR